MTTGDSPGGSVSFDRAAGYYDRTRGLSPEAEARQTAVLLDALDGVPAPVLEIGIGTGRVALPLARAGVRVLGVDLSPAMLGRLRDKGGSAVPVACGDATRLPVADDAVGAVLLAHVLHLVADWQAVVAEAHRVLRPGGVLLATRGGSRSGGQDPLSGIQAQARAAAGWTVPPGRLDDLAPLDELLAAQGATVDHLPEVATGRRITAAEQLQSMADNVYSWTWDFTPAQRDAAVAAAREFATRTYGDPASVVIESPPIAWRRYRLPGSSSYG